MPIRNAGACRSGAATTGLSHCFYELWLRLQLERETSATLGLHAKVLLPDPRAVLVRAPFAINELVLVERFGCV
jgi:hypothetical protein